jgi:hypothetical protein
MSNLLVQLRGLCAAAACILSVSACATGAESQTFHRVNAGLVSLDVYDRSASSSLPVFVKDGRRYIVGTPGHEYALRIRNNTAGRVLVVTSVDGLNVISGATAAPDQSGYVLDAWGSVEITGWRKSLDRIAAFFFTEHENSYAARTGRPLDVSVIGVAAFREKVRPMALHDDTRYRSLPATPESSSRRNDAEPDVGRADQPSAAAAPAESNAADIRPQASEARRAQSKLGTGHGRSESSRVTVVSFERASATPSQTIAVQYDRRENLVALGVLPPAYVSRREPEPFPGGLRFAPDPDR